MAELEGCKKEDRQAAQAKNTIQTIAVNCAAISYEEGKTGENHQKNKFHCFVNGNDNSPMKLQDIVWWVSQKSIHRSISFHLQK